MITLDTSETLVIPGKLPNLNDIIAAAKVKHGPNSYPSMKRSWTEVIAMLARNQMEPIKGRVDIVIRSYEPDKRRDPDNVCAGAFKFILDGLVKAGIIETDSQKVINDMRFPPIRTDKINPRVEVLVKVVGDE